MAWWSRSKTERRAAASKPAAPARRSSDPAIIHVHTTPDEIVVRLADNVAAIDHPAASVAWSVEHYRLSITNSGMRDVSAAESETLVDVNPDIAAGLTEMRVFAYPLVLARGGQRHRMLFDAVRETLADTPQPMQVSQFQHVQKTAVERVVAELERQPVGADDQSALPALKGMLHWSY